MANYMYDFVMPFSLTYINFDNAHHYVIIKSIFEEKCLVLGIYLKHDYSLYHILLKGLPYGKVPIKVLVDGKNEGTTHLNVGNKFEFLNNEMDDIISPIEFFCQILKMSDEDRESLDKYLGEKMSNDISSPMFEGKVDDEFLSSSKFQYFRTLP
jgi:hypothetical protein